MKRQGHSLRRDPSWPGDFNVDLMASSFGDPSSAFHHFSTGPSLLSDLGTFSSTVPDTSPAFGYSQKNFHISDGNLYSVLSPFQARKSSARPSFLRGHSCVTSTSTSTTTSSAPKGENATGLRSESSAGSRRHKLKFHNQEMPPSCSTSAGTSSSMDRGHRHFRSKLSVQSETDHEASVGDSGASNSSWFESPFCDDPFASLHSDTGSSFLSKRLKPQQRRRSTMEMEEEDIEKEDSHHRLFRNHEWESEKISLSSKRSYTHRFSSSSSSNTATTTKSENSWNINKDDDGPLNLCLADRQKKSSFPMSSRIKRDLNSENLLRDELDSDTDTFPFSRKDFHSRDRKFDFSSIFDDFEARSKFSSKNNEGENEFFKTSRGSIFDDEPRVLDLSMKGRQNKPSTFTAPDPKSAFIDAENQFINSSYVQSCQMPLETDLKHKRFPRISEMFENMRLQDDDLYQSVMKRYQATRERLMQTHPEMFVGWERERMNLAQDIKPFGSEDGLIPPKDFLGCPTKGNPRPKSWDVPPDPMSESSTVPADISRPESAEACLESTDFLPGASFPFPVETRSFDAYAAQQCPTVAQETTKHRPEIPHTSSFTEVQGILKSHSRQGTPVGPSPCASCTEVPSSSSRGAKSKHPELKIKTESGGGVTHRTKIRQRKSTTETQSSQYTNDISICKFKLTKGINPVLEEKKSFFVPLPRASPSSQQSQKQQPGVSERTSGGATPNPVPGPSPSCSASPLSAGAPNAAAGMSAADNFRTFKIHVGSQEEMGRKLAAGKRLRRRSRKALAREKLEATFREQGFLIKTQQVSSAEGAVYCKFRQLKKFTRYLFKSWKDYLPKDLDDISKTNPPNSQT